MSKQAFRLATTIYFLLIGFFDANAQNAVVEKLEKMPADLETDYALSALPAHLRKDATVYLIDPEKGYYVGKQGTNGFVCFVARTEWEWAEFRKDLATPISYDAEGARTIFPVYIDVAAMRASGKFSPQQVKDTIMSRMARHVYKAPARPGISYMLAPLMRVYPGMPDDKSIITVSMPHYMFYAPYMLDSDVGTVKNDEHGPVLLNAGQFVMGERKGPHGYIIVRATEEDAKKIVEEGRSLEKRLIAYKAYFKPEPAGGHH